MMTYTLTIKRVSPTDPQVSAFIDELDRFQKSLYPAESNHLDPREVLAQPNCRFLGAYHEGRLVGIGAAKMLGRYGELKRFYLADDFRGQGIAECIVAALEKWLYDNQVFRSFLETGIHQNAALRFYEKLGYTRCAPFGEYQPDPLSVFMTKNLAASGSMKRLSTSPFYVVAFSSQLKERSKKYDEVASEMVRLASDEPGYIGIISTRNPNGGGFTASYWETSESILRWRQNPAHLVAQQLGRTEFYSQFKTTVALIE
jgi:putative acetyltransferase